MAFFSFLFSLYIIIIIPTRSRFAPWFFFLPLLLALLSGDDDRIIRQE